MTEIGKVLSAKKFSIERKNVESLSDENIIEWSEAQINKEEPLSQKGRIKILKNNIENAPGLYTVVLGYVCAEERIIDIQRIDVCVHSRQKNFLLVSIFLFLLFLIAVLMWLDFQ